MVVRDGRIARRRPGPDHDRLVEPWVGCADGPLFILGDAADHEDGIDSGVGGSPNTAIPQPFADQFDSGNWKWTIDIARRGARPGEIRFTLRRSPAAAPDGSLDVQAVYVHRGRWGSESNIASCSW